MPAWHVHCNFKAVDHTAGLQITRAGLVCSGDLPIKFHLQLCELLRLIGQPEDVGRVIRGHQDCQILVGLGLCATLHLRHNGQDVDLRALGQIRRSYLQLPSRIRPPCSRTAGAALPPSPRQNQVQWEP